jgi:hypothetical protein
VRTNYLFLIQKKKKKKKKKKERKKERRRRYVMVMNTRSGSQINRQAKVQLEPVIQSHLNPGVQNNSQPQSFPLSGGGDQDCRAALEA